MTDRNRRDIAEERAAHTYAALVRLYPPEHRARFGAQMLRTFQDQYRDAHASGEVGPAFWLAVIGDETRNIAKEHLMASHPKRLSAELVTLMVYVLACVLTFAQGTAPLVLNEMGIGGRGVFIARHFPHGYQTYVCVAAISLGALLFCYAPTLGQRYRNWATH